MSSSYQPFLISEFKTGLYNYLEPWIRPQDAFDPSTNAYIYRGSLNKRMGYSFFGNLAYCDNVTIATGNNGSAYSGTLASHPIRAGSMTVSVLTSGGFESYSDNGANVLTGTLLGTGTINYTSGAWAINTGANTVAAGILIVGGYTYIPTTISTPVLNPIMGLKEFTNENNDSQVLLGLDTRRASLYNASTLQFDPLCSVSQILWIGQAAVTSRIVNVNFIHLAPYSVTITDGTNTMTDDGAGGFPGAGNMKNTTTVNYATGAIDLEITAASAATYTITFKLAGNYFTGNNSNFFNSTNWLSNLYLANDADPITLFNGTTLSRPPFGITLAHVNSFTNDIKLCLDVKVYKNSLLVVRPQTASIPEGQTVRWSAVNNPTNLAADIAGNGGALAAPTDDWINSLKFLRDILVGSFENSTFNFRFTGNSNDPFRWDKINNSKSTLAPYASIEYDERVTSVGSKGLIASDGVNVQRYDISIIDQFLDINQQRIGQCFSQRYDTLNQTWMLYPSIQNATATQTSDTVLIYNFIENTWSTYSIAMSCLGLFFNTTGKTWANSPIAWQNCDFAWNSTIDQVNDPILLGGDIKGNVFKLIDDTALTDNGTAITTSITSTRWNPFVATGQRVQFGWIDFYYEIEPQAILTITFFTNNSESPAAIRTLTLDGPVNDTNAWKRVYLNLVGEFVRINISDSSNANWKILGQILWARDSGRLTP